MVHFSFPNSLTCFRASAGPAKLTGTDKEDSRLFEKDAADAGETSTGELCASVVVGQNTDCVIWSNRWLVCEVSMPSACGYVRPQYLHGSLIRAL